MRKDIVSTVFVHCPIFGAITEHVVCLKAGEAGFFLRGKRRPLSTVLCSSSWRRCIRITDVYSALGVGIIICLVGLNTGSKNSFGSFSLDGLGGFCFTRTLFYALERFDILFFKQLLKSRRIYKKLDSRWQFFSDWPHMTTIKTYQWYLK